PRTWTTGSTPPSGKKTTETGLSQRAALCKLRRPFFGFLHTLNRRTHAPGFELARDGGVIAPVSGRFRRDPVDLSGVLRWGAHPGRARVRHEPSKQSLVAGGCSRLCRHDTCHALAGTTLLFVLWTAPAGRHDARDRGGRFGALTQQRCL